MAKPPFHIYANVPDRSLQAKPEDVTSTSSIIRASYESISGPAGQPRDWNRSRSLFVPDARLIRTGRSPDGNIGYTVMNLDQYAEQVDGWLVENGFFETEVHSVVEQFGNIAHVFSTYESRRNADDREPFMRGINSFQLLHDGSRWWIVTIFWQHESAENPLPDKYGP